MGLFGGGNSRNETKNYTTTYNQGFSEVAGPATAIGGSGNTVIHSDQGAIAGAFDFGGRALDAHENIVRDVIAANGIATSEMMAHTAKQSAGFASNLAGLAERTAQNNDQRMVQMAGIAVGAVALVAIANAYRKRRAA